MGTWHNLKEGFTVNERLPDTLVDIAVGTFLIALLSYIDHHK